MAFKPRRVIWALAVLGVLFVYRFVTADAALTKPPNSSPETLYQRALEDYAHDRYLEAAEGLLMTLLKDPAPAEISRRAAYLLNILITQKLPEKDLELFFQSSQLDAAYRKLITAYRKRDYESAKAGLLYLLFVEEPKNAATQLLAQDLLNSLAVRVSEPYQKWWRVEIPSAANIVLDAQGRLWVLSRNPAQMAQLDETGQIQQRIPLEASPIARRLAQDWKKVPLAFFQDGSFVIDNVRFTSAGKERMRYPLSAAADDITADGKDNLYVFSAEGLQKFDKEGRRLFRTGSRGVGKGRFSSPQGLSVSGDRLALADGKRIQLFDTQGKIQSMLGEGGDIPWLFRDPPTGVALDQDGFLYVGPNEGKLQIFNPQSLFVAEIPQTASEIEVDPRGIIYCLDGGAVIAYLPIHGGAHRLKALEPSEAGLKNQRFNKPQEIIVVAKEEARADFRSHTNTRPIHRIVSDPDDPSVLWLATQGGLVKYESKRERWQKWTRAEGLSGNSVNDVLAAGQGGRIWAATQRGLSVLDPQGLRFETLSSASNEVQLFQLKEILSGPENPATLWFLEERGLIRLDPEKDRWNFFPISGGLQHAVFMPDRRAFLVQSQTRIWFFDPLQETSKVLLDIDALTDLSPPRYPNAGITMMTMSYDPKTGQVWIGTLSDGVFVYDFAAQKPSLAVPYPMLPENCPSRSEWSPPAIYPAGDRLYLIYGCHFGEWAEGKIDWKSLSPSAPPVFYEVVPDRSDPRKLWLATSEGLMSYHPKRKGAFLNHRPPESEPGGNFVASMQERDGTLWVSYHNGGRPSFFDPVSRRWGVLEELNSVTSPPVFQEAQRIVPDPADPQNVWILDGDTVRLIDTRSGKILRSRGGLSAYEPEQIAVTGGTSPKVWLGNFEGVIELQDKD